MARIRIEQKSSKKVFACSSWTDYTICYRSPTGFAAFSPRLRRGEADEAVVISLPSRPVQRDADLDGSAMNRRSKISPLVYFYIIISTRESSLQKNPLAHFIKYASTARTSVVTLCSDIFINPYIDMCVHI